jgi:uncharacterized protein YjaZ
MAVINTRDLLESDFAKPSKIIEKYNTFISEPDPGQFYQYLKSHGMYTPSLRVKKDLGRLIDEDIWGRTKQIFKKYMQLWDGFDIPVFIFPYRESGGWTRSRSNKSGLAFKDKLFLFVNSSISEKELEAVFVHEYHHVCRLNLLEKNSDKFTLLDSMIMEGLAEFAVSKHVGTEYLAHWTSLYSEKELLTHYQRYLKDRLQTTRTERLHDELLLGIKSYPTMLGYCMGYYLVNKSKLLPVKQTFTISSDAFLTQMDTGE